MASSRLASLLALLPVAVNALPVAVNAQQPAQQPQPPLAVRSAIAAAQQTNVALELMWQEIDRLTRRLAEAETKCEPKEEKP
jgi:hypothetical protein